MTYVSSMTCVMRPTNTCIHTRTRKYMHTYAHTTYIYTTVISIASSNNNKQQITRVISKNKSNQTELSSS